MKIDISKYVPDDFTRKLLLDTYDSGNLVQGKMVETFEQGCCEMSGAKYAAAVSNGTVAITLMLAVQETTKPIQVITNPLSFIATRNAIKHAGCIPRFVDVNYETGMLNQEQVRSKAFELHDNYCVFVAPVDLHGDRDPIEKQYPVSTFLRDSSQAHGLKIQESDDAMSFSFHASKNATAGEGGVVVSNDENLIEEIKLLRNHGMDSNRNIVRGGAYNARMTDLQAAVGVGSLSQLNLTNEMRTNNACYYDEWLFERLIEDREDSNLRLPREQNIYHHYVLRHPQAEKIITILRYKGIDARRYYDKLIAPNSYTLPNAQRICDESFCIPVHEHLTKEEREFIVDSVIEVVRHLDHD